MSDTVKQAETRERLTAEPMIGAAYRCPHCSRGSFINGSKPIFMLAQGCTIKLNCGDCGGPVEIKHKQSDKPRIVSLDGSSRHTPMGGGR